MKVKNTKVFPFLQNQELGDVVFPHESQCIYNKHFRFDGLWIFCHDIFCSQRKEIGSFFQHSSQVAIGNDPGKFVAIKHSRSAKAAG